MAVEAVDQLTTLAEDLGLGAGGALEQGHTAGCGFLELVGEVEAMLLLAGFGVGQFPFCLPQPSPTSDPVILRAGVGVDATDARFVVAHRPLCGVPALLSGVHVVNLDRLLLDLPPISLDQVVGDVDEIAVVEGAHAGAANVQVGALKVCFARGGRQTAFSDVAPDQFGDVAPNDVPISLAVGHRDCAIGVGADSAQDAMLFATRPPHALAVLVHNVDALNVSAQAVPFTLLAPRGPRHPVIAMVRRPDDHSLHHQGWPG